MMSNTTLLTDSTLHSLMLNNKSGLQSLKEDHHQILNSLTTKYSDKSRNNVKTLQDTNIKQRINAVTESLQMLDVGISETNIMIGLKNHFDQMEADKVQMKLEMKRVKDENDWLRDELEETEKKLHEALGKITDLEEEKRCNDFLKEVKIIELDLSGKPITPSKIPVGHYRLEEEKAINKALNGCNDSNRQPKTRSCSPVAPSRIPKFFGANYSKVKEKIEKSAAEKCETQKKLRGKSYKLSLTPAGSQSSIPVR